jgi:hypothetical protein
MTAVFSRPHFLIAGVLAVASLGCNGSTEPPGDDVDSVSFVSVDVETDGPDRSFTTPFEALVRLRAELSPPDAPVEVEWVVVDEPTDRVPTPAPQTPLVGAETFFLVPRPAASRWDTVPHPGELDQKSLSLRINARVVVEGDTVMSDPQAVTQDEIDTVKQEYVDLGRQRFPGRNVFGTPSSEHFKSSDLNPTGDYRVYWSEGRMLGGLEALLAVIEERFQTAGLPFERLTLTSVFRNPVHHAIHAGLTTRESQHQYGLAADLRIWDQAVTREEFFAELRDAAKSDAVGACFEPEELIRGGSSDGQTLTHAHVDWRDTCPIGW